MALDQCKQLRYTRPKRYRRWNPQRECVRLWNRVWARWCKIPRRKVRQWCVRKIGRSTRDSLVYQRLFPRHNALGFPKDVVVEYSLTQLPLLCHIKAVYASNSKSGEGASKSQTVAKVLYERQFIAQSPTGINVLSALGKFER